MSSPAERYREFLERGGVADLSDRVKLQLTGADRVRYLNGQVTANVSRLVPSEAMPACVTTAKGKLCADVWLHAAGDALFLDADATVRETLPARIERYIIADDVTLDDVTSELRLIHLLPPASEPAGSALRTDFGRFDHLRARRFGRDGMDFFLSADDAAELLGALASRHVMLDDSLLETLRIEAGVPRWGRELGEDTLPPEAGLDRTHIDYHKGCYIGQEVISRLKSVGHVNRHLSGFVAEDREPLQAGWRLYAAGDETREVGVLTSAAWSFALDTPVALGYLKRGSPEGGLLARAADEPSAGRPVRASDLPLVS
jgi:folate-binding protein YgfZ